MTNQKSRIWRDIDKHPLPDKSFIDVKLKCGSVLIGCYFNKGISRLNNGKIFWNKCTISTENVTQWRDAK